MNIYSRKLKMRKDLKGPEMPQSSLDVTSDAQNRETKNAAECMKQASSIIGAFRLYLIIILTISLSPW
ncbi:hypothetical protein C2845_PM18G09190 [Panicum miliaceum]|uniref:Uncharacterized protein n=1 Tax=Panicum miliaceum TaxID=4540 RepID=A0A3L6PI14_PANMI|nr:hypothetical protein C2845_PM18G09190 [Panicum miliaceum]